MPKFPSKVKVINIKVKVIIDLKGTFLYLEGALLHSLPKSEGAMAPLASLVPTSLAIHQAFTHPVLVIMMSKM